MTDPVGVERVAEVLARERCEDIHESTGGVVCRACTSWGTYVAQALIAAGLVLTDEWVVEERVEWGVTDPMGLTANSGNDWSEHTARLIAARQGWGLVSRTVTTATKTTPWEASDGVG